MSDDLGTAVDELAAAKCAFETARDNLTKAQWTVDEILRENANRFLWDTSGPEE